MSEESENVIVDKHNRKHDKEKKKHRKRESTDVEAAGEAPAGEGSGTENSVALSPVERRKSRKRRTITVADPTDAVAPPAYESTTPDLSAGAASDDEAREDPERRRRRRKDKKGGVSGAEDADEEKKEEEKEKEEKKEEEEEKEKEKELEPTTTTTTTTEAPAARESDFDEEEELAGLDGLDIEEELGGECGYGRLYTSRCVLESFTRLSAWAQEKGLPASASVTPEIVFVGPGGVGKSSLIEAVLGRPLNGTVACGTARVVYLHLCGERRSAVLKADAGTPKDTVLSDASSAALAAALAARNASNNDVINGAAAPLHVELGGAGALRMTLIDTPALGAATEAAVLREMRVPGRLIVAVLPAAAAPASPNTDPVLRAVRRADPELGRTAVVYTGLRAMLEARLGAPARALNRALAGAMPEVDTFFATLVHPEVRRPLCDAADDAAFKRRVLQYGARDLATLEQCGFDRELAHTIGAHSFARFVAEYVWAEHKKAAPRIPAALRARRAAKAAELDAALAQARAVGAAAAETEGEDGTEKKPAEEAAGSGSSSTRFFRALAARYAADLVGTLQALVRGTAAGVPLGCGQTAEQERAACPNDGQWTDARGTPLDAAAAAGKLRGAEALLYGGQQFERLLSEFRLVCAGLAMPELSEDDVVVAAGSFKASSAQNLALAACDLARQKIEDLYAPLIDQLAERALYVLKRLVDVAAQILSAKNANTNAAQPQQQGFNNVRNVDQYNYFIHFIKEKYCAFVDAAAEHCKARCLEEFYPTHTVYWDITENETLKQIESTAQVRELAQSIFASLSARTSKNILVKFYSLLLLPTQAGLAAELQRDVAALSKEELEELFEIENVNDDAMNAEISIRADIEELEELEKSAAENVSAFCHPKI